MTVLIIAEAGVNHNGDLETACQLVAAAAAAGADMVKFQTFNARKLVTSDAAKAAYQIETTGRGEGQLEMIQKLELSSDHHRILIDECRSHGVRFFSTAFDAESFDMLLAMGLDQVKIPSGELTNLPLLRHMTRYGLPVMLSTGMATLGEVEAALDVIERNGTPRNLITVLHCTTEYPAPMTDVNLRAMQTMGTAFGVKVGYSDHSSGIEIPIAAVALGATVIEKHFTLDRNQPGPDHKASLEPSQFRSMVDAIRHVEVALGDGIKRPCASEVKNKPIARKSIVAARKIQAGEIFSPYNLEAKRPGTGISPMQWDDVIGRVAKRDFDIDELIEL